MKKGDLTELMPLLAMFFKSSFKLLTSDSCVIARGRRCTCPN
jgi:hypothetical protein